MPDHLGSDMRKQKKSVDADDDKPFQGVWVLPARSGGEWTPDLSLDIGENWVAIPPIVPLADSSLSKLITSSASFLLHSDK
ncbi:hypothetical protein KIN20_013522 [Parelaphostrongylus tenuis]|uniref:Uncharacterized protein n=1 Tax=Parelaphostrongylus tenuis TaxID=148309 RepID=A0AAD5MW83_PARTN|nr:hypothetical protein KIN20_013522 [Parelaphostrongylus tenuis]